MPKRSNEFQQLIAMLTQLLGDGAVIEESKMLTDRISGEQREVDVVAEGILAGHKMVVSIEVRDHGRRQGLEWIEQAHDKHSRLPTNLLILVSKSGFTPSALEKAASYGIKAITPSQVDSNLAGEVATSLGMKVKGMVITEALAHFTTPIPQEWHALNPRPAEPDEDIMFRHADEQPLVSASDYKQAVVFQHAKSDVSWMSEAAHEYDLTIPLEGPMYQGERLHVLMTADEQPATLFPVDKFTVTAKVKTTDRADMALTAEGEYDGRRFMTGTSPMGDKQARFVVADLPDCRRMQAQFPMYVPPPRRERRRRPPRPKGK